MSRVRLQPRCAGRAELIGPVATAEAYDRDVPVDEYVLDTPVVRAFIDSVRAAIGDARAATDAIGRIRPEFAELLADPEWLPAAYQEPAPESGMGGGIGQWLLYRAGDGSLSLFSLVVPPDAQTPVHDHLAWGLVGLYRGTQEEQIFAGDAGSFRMTEQRALRPGDFYALIPPRDDIHRVRTTSAKTSVSIHLLANDTGCVWRHAYDPGSGEQRPFRSGYVNAPCEPDEAEDTAPI
jgi:predicted metal-dependent enzyme (double-stranded beta helix superfamily)